MNRKDTTRIVQEDGKENGRFVLFENDIFAGEMIYTWKGKTTLFICKKSNRKEPKSPRSAEQPNPTPLIEITAKNIKQVLLSRYIVHKLPYPISFFPWGQTYKSVRVHQTG